MTTLEIALAWFNKNDLDLYVVPPSGEEIYYGRIRPLVIDNHREESLCLDVESSDYELDADEIAADRRLRARRPDGQFFGIRVGYTTAGAMGGTLRPDEP